MIVGLDHVQVAAPAGCEDDARAFYGVLLGLEEIEKPRRWPRGGVWFRAGRHEFHVGVTDDFVAAAKAHPALRVSSVAELERLETNRMPIDRPDPAEIRGRARLHAFDPWGNRLELLA